MTTIAPCPFCAGECHLDFGMTAFVDAVVSCTVCSAQGPIHDESVNAEDNGRLAVAAWNTRPKCVVPPPPQYVDGPWASKKIDGAWRVGLAGNLDTIHDAVVTINSHTEDDSIPRGIADWIAALHNQVGGPA